ncbi:MAG TPA: Wzt carbohydrate-binding domain-containing protein, partial [Tepidisphaeraceae bacterium]|nr:Wzt carbohydrate-binding domain-containing protein [Tepidisphaeraceae bacterium]
ILCNGEPSNCLPMGGQLAIEVDFAARVPVQHPRIGFLICDADGNRLINANNRFQTSESFSSPTSRGTIRANLGQVPFVAGKYNVSLYLGGQVDDTHIEQEALWFEVIPVDIWGAGKVPPSDVSPFWWPLKIQLTSESEMPTCAVNDKP